jgi:hypothetical protein
MTPTQSGLHPTHGGCQFEIEAITLRTELVEILNQLQVTQMTLNDSAERAERWRRKAKTLSELLLEARPYVALIAASYEVLPSVYEYEAWAHLAHIDRALAEGNS